MSRANMDESRCRLFNKRRKLDAKPAPDSKYEFSASVVTDEVVEMLKSDENLIVDVRNCYEVNSDGKLNASYFANVPVTQISQVFGLNSNEFEVSGRIDQGSCKITLILEFIKCEQTISGHKHLGLL